MAITLATNSGSLARTGFAFAGWNTSADGSGTNYAAGASYTGNESLTLYALWAELIGFTWLPVTQFASGTTFHNWGTTGNWSTDTVPSAAGAVVNFTSDLQVPSQTVALSSTRTVGTVNLGLPGSTFRYNFSNNPLILKANAGNTLGTATINANNNTQNVDGHVFQGQVGMQVENVVLNLNSAGARLNFFRHFTDSDGDATRSPTMTLNAVEGAGVQQFAAQAGSTSRNAWGRLVVNQYATFRNANSNQTNNVVNDLVMGANLAKPVADAITLNGGTLQGENPTLTYHISANRGITLGTLGGTLQRSWTIDSAITGPGGLTVAPIETSRPTTLNALNSYQGDTIVNGTLVVTSGNAIPDSGKLVINTGGKINPSGTTETVATLFFGTVQQAAGTWGATGSGATNINDTYFTGTGVVSVTGVPESSAENTPFEQWVGAPVTDFGGDANGDGISNGMAYLLGATVPEEDAHRLLPAPAWTNEGLTLSFRVLDIESRGNASISVEYGSNLVDWTTAQLPDTSATNTDGVVFEIGGSGLQDVKVTIPSSKAAGGKLYVRLKASED